MRLDQVEQLSDHFEDHLMSHLFNLRLLLTFFSFTVRLCGLNREHMHWGLSARIVKSGVDSARQLDQSEDHGGDSELHSGITSLNVDTLELVKKLKVDVVVGLMEHQVR